jgi:hypothetical protein
MYYHWDMSASVIEFPCMRHSIAAYKALLEEAKESSAVLQHTVRMN